MVDFNDRRTRMIMLAVLCVGLFATFVFGAAQRSVWYDEAMTISVLNETTLPSSFYGPTQAEALNSYIIGNASPQSVIDRLIERDVHPFAYFLIADAWTWVFGDTLFSVRLLSAVLAIASILLFHRMVSTAGLTNPLVYTLVFSLSFFLSFAAIDARSGSLVILCSVLILYLFNLAERQRLQDQAPPLAQEVLFGATAACLVLTHYFAAFLAIPLMAWRGLRFLRTRSPRDLIAPVTALLLVLPWSGVTLLHLGARPGQGNGFEGLVVWALTAANQVSHLLISSTESAFPIGLVLAGQILVLFGITAALAWLLQKRLKSDSPSALIVLQCCGIALAALIFFTALLWLTDKWTKDLRYFAVFLPVTTILAVFGLFRLGHLLRRATERYQLPSPSAIAGIPVGALILLQAANINLGQEKIASAPGHYWKTIAQKLETTGVENGLVIIDAGIGPGNILAAVLELPPETRLFVLPKRIGDWTDITESLSEEIAPSQSIWLSYTIVRGYDAAREDGVYQTIIDLLPPDQFAEQSSATGSQASRYAHWARIE